MSRHPVPGDPASIARLATATTSAARSVGALVADPLVLPPDTGVSRRVERHLSSRLTSLHAAAALVARELDTVGTALQHHSQALATAIADLRSLRERGEQAGLALVDGRWQPGWGITGAVDRDDGDEREALTAQWQHAHDALVRTATRRRAELGRLLDESRARMAAEAITVRLG